MEPVWPQHAATAADINHAPEQTKDLAATRYRRVVLERQMQLEQRSLPIEKIETNTCGFTNPRTYLGD